MPQGPALDLHEKQYGSLRCLISEPPGSPPPEGSPVLVFLHGSKEAAPMDLRAALTAHGPLRPGSARAAAEKFVVVAPQLPAPGGDVWAARADAVRDIAVDIAREYSGNLAQVYLTGFSYGGNGVLDIGSSQADFWAALWPVDPTRAPAVSTSRPVWISAGQYSRNNKESFRSVWGVRDRARSASQPQQHVYEDAGLDHVATATAAYRDATIYDWLLQHRSR